MKSSTKTQTELQTIRPNLSVQEAASYIGISVRMLRELLALRKIKKVRIGAKRIIVRRKDIDDYLESLAS